MSTTVLLPRRVQAGSDHRATSQSSALGRLEASWVRAALREGKGDGPAWTDVRQKAAAHFHLLVVERGGGRGDMAGFGSSEATAAEAGSSPVVESAASEVMGCLARRDQAGVGLVREDQLWAALVQDLR